MFLGPGSPLTMGPAIGESCLLFNAETTASPCEPWCASPGARVAALRLGLCQQPPEGVPPRGWLVSCYFHKLLALSSFVPTMLLVVLFGLKVTAHQLWTETLETVSLCPPLRLS